MAVKSSAGYQQNGSFAGISRGGVVPSGGGGGGGSFGIPNLPDIFGGGGPRVIGSVGGVSAGQIGGIGSPPGYGAGGGGGVPGPPPGAVAPTGGTTNYAQEDPNLKFGVDRFKERFSTDPTQRAIERSTSNIRDTASGLMKEAKTDAARRGVFGQGDSGVLDQAQTQIGNAAQRAAASAGAGISLGREQDLDRLATAGPAVLGAPAQLSLQQQNLGLAQQKMGQEAQLAQMQAATQNQQMIANLWGSYMGMLR